MHCALEGADHSTDQASLEVSGSSRRSELRLTRTSTKLARAAVTVPSERVQRSVCNGADAATTAIVCIRDAKAVVPGRLRGDRGSIRFH